MMAGCNMKMSHSKFLEFLDGVFMSKFDKTVSKKNKNKKKGIERKAVDFYWTWLCKSYTDDNKGIRWCPNPVCESVV